MKNSCHLSVVSCQLLALLALLLIASAPMLAQDNPQSNSTQRVDRDPQSETRVGVSPGKRVNLTMREAITYALENNRDLEVEKFNVQLNEFDFKGAQGAYDPTFTSGFFYNRQRTPVANPLAGGENGGLLTDGLSGSATMTQRIMKHGSVVQGSYENLRDTTQNLFNALNPQITTRFSVTYTQPLMRNRTNDASRRFIKLTKKRLDISDSQFRQRAIEIIAQVQRAYWDLVFARRDQEIKRESVELATTQLKHNERLVEAGTLAPSDIIAARVELERRNDEAAAALDLIQRAENGLKNLMLQPSNTELWEAEIVTTETPQLDSTASLPLGDAIKLANANRPEMQQFKLRNELNEIDTAFFKDQTKPQIDFVTSYATTGLAGTERTEINFFQASSELQTRRLNELSRLAGLPPLPSGGTFATPDFLIGGYGQSFVNVLKNNFRTLRFGINISLPLRNRTALANLGRSLAEGRQIETQRQRFAQQIEVEVRNALQSIETTKRRVEAAKNSRANAELQYASEQRKFDAGQSTNFLVLDRQNALSAARGRELRALTDYTKAVAELQRALSTTLSSNSVEIQSAIPNQ